MSLKSSPFRPADGPEMLHLLSVLWARSDIDAPVAEESIRSGRVKVCVLAERLLVVYSIGSSWCTTKKYLVEVFSLALEPVTGHLSELSEAYSTLARHLGCDEVNISTELHERKAAVNRVVHGWGFQLLGSTFSRKTSWES